MSIFWLQGKVDKRILAYPLVRACMMDGRTLVVSDDGCFKHMFKQGGMYGGNDYVTYCIDPGLRIPPILHADEYTHIVYVTADTSNIPFDCCVRCVGNSTEFLAENPYFEEEELKEQEYRVVLATDFKKGNIAGKEKKIGIPVNITGERLLYCSACEEAKELLPVKDNTVAKVVAHMASHGLSMKEDQLVKLLKRPANQLSAKEGAR